MLPFSQNTPASIVHCPPGYEMPITDVAYIPGDFILVRGKAFTDRMIQLGQKWRFKGVNSVFGYWTHAAMVVGIDGQLIEADPTGVHLANIAKYKPNDYLYVSIYASEEDRKEAVNFAKYCIGQKYGFFTILSIAISLLTGLKFSFGFDGQEICSGLVARCLERTSVIFQRDSSHLTPADLALSFNVRGWTRQVLSTTLSPKSPATIPVPANPAGSGNSAVFPDFRDL